MTYTKQTWNDGPDGGTPKSAARLTHIEDGIAEAHRMYDQGYGAADVDEVNVGESTTSTAWADLLTQGPTVQVEVGPTGRVLVIMSAQIRTGFATGGEMGVEASGPSAVAPSQQHALRWRPHAAGSDGYVQASAAIPLFGLQPGTYTFTARYRSTQGESVIFNHRRLIVMPI